MKAIDDQQPGIPGITETILRREQVLQATGLSSSALDRLDRSRDFPAKVRLAGRSVGWPASQVAKWIADRIEQAQAARRDAAWPAN